MATTQADISQWFDEGKRRNAAYMIVCCDTVDHEDYPVYAATDAECIEKYQSHNGSNMQRVMEVYDLSMDRDSQLQEFRAFHLPKVG